MDRRGFLRFSAAAGGGLAINAMLPAVSRAGEQAGLALGLYCSIQPDNRLAFVLTKHEMGQGIATCLAAIFADELGADWERVDVEYVADNARPHTLGSTGGSGSVRDLWLPLRKAAAHVRGVLVAAAARRWGVDPAGCEASGSSVRERAGGRIMSFAAAAKLVSTGAADVAAPKTLDELNKLDIALRPDTQLRLVGTDLGNKYGRKIARGAQVYASDIQVEGMLYAVLARCPTFRGKLKSFDAAAALAVPGVRRVVPIEGYISPFAGPERQASGWTIKDSVAVIADSTWAALRGRAALRVEWEEGPNGAASNASFEQLVTAKMAAPAELTSTLESAAPVGSASRTLEAVYDYPYQTHACMEPMNCVAHHQGTRCEVWVGTQFPNGIIRNGARLFKLPEAAMHVNVLPSGGAFGRRFYPDVALEALKVSQAAGNVPVKVVWTRADDLQHDNFHPCYRGHYRASLDGARLLAWYHKEARAYWGTGKAAELPWMAYDIPRVQADFMGSLHDDSVLQAGAWRSVVANNWAFGQECFMDEVAQALGEDPYQLRRRLLQGGREIAGVIHSPPGRTISSARMLAVLELAAARAGWDRPFAPKGGAPGTRYGRGIAVYPYMHGNSYCAQVVEVAVTGTELRLLRVVVAADCGRVIDPVGVRKQMEGGVIWGLSAALHGGVRFENGRVGNSNFHDNPVLRMRECPRIEVHLVDEPGPTPWGSGELSTPVVVPALMNAVFAATGKRIRKLPLVPADLA